MKRTITSWTHRLYQPIDLASLAVFRIFFGLMMLWEVCRYILYGRIYRYWIQPPFHFTYFGFEWVSPWPGVGMYIHFVVLGLLALCITLGLAYRWAMLLFWLGFTYVFLLEQTQYLNHFYFISLVSLIMVFVPAHQQFSLGGRQRERKHLTFGPAWTLYLLRFQVGIVYFFGGIAKLNGDWLQGEPIRMWLEGRGGEGLVYLVCFGGLLFDLCIPFLLLYRKTRIYAFATAVLFHLANAHLFNIGIFPWFMIGATALFFNPEWPRRFLKADQPDLSTPVFAPQPVTTLLILLYAAIQLVTPLRHHLYPGNVNWTEEGHYFAWRMKLNKRQGQATFYVTNLDTSKGWKVNPLTLLPAWQVARMQTSAGQLLQFAHYLEREFNTRGYPNLSIRVKAWVSLNGREPQHLVDPERNLCDISPSLLPVDWIVPLKSSLPAKHENP